MLDNKVVRLRYIKSLGYIRDIQEKQVALQFILNQQVRVYPNTNKNPISKVPEKRGNSYLSLKASLTIVKPRELKIPAEIQVDRDNN